MLNETEPQFPSEYKGKEEATCISQDATQKKKNGNTYVEFFQN